MRSSGVQSVTLETPWGHRAIPKNFRGLRLIYDSRRNHQQTPDNVQEYLILEDLVRRGASNVPKFAERASTDRADIGATPRPPLSSECAHVVEEHAATGFRDGDDVPFWNH